MILADRLQDGAQTNSKPWVWIFFFCSYINPQHFAMRLGTELGAVDGYRDMEIRRKGAMIHWSKSPEVERNPEIVSGAWVVRGTRIPAQAVIDNAEDGYTAEEIVAEIYPTLPLEPARRIIALAERAHAAHTIG